MNYIDLSKTLKKYKTGWVLLNKNNVVVAHATSFLKVMEKAEQYSSAERSQLKAFPASDNYFGFITSALK